jgi:hypothetical protein
MLTVRQRWIVMTIACGLLTAYIAPDTAMAGKKKKDTCKPGVDGNFKWQRIGINQARKAGKPILFYVYDPMEGKASSSVKVVQKEIFASLGVQQAFADFTPVMQPHTATNWPPVFTQQAKRGIALYVMTCDARPIALFTHRNLPKAVTGKDGNAQYVLLQSAAAAALKANPKALEAMKRNPPKEYLSPEELAAKRTAIAEPEDPEEQENKSAAKNVLEGALGEPEGNAGPKGAPKSSDVPLIDDEDE